MSKPMEEDTNMEPVQMFYDMENLDFDYPSDQDKVTCRQSLAGHIDAVLKAHNRNYVLERITICANVSVLTPEILKDIEAGATAFGVQVTHKLVPRRNLGKCEGCSELIHQDQDVQAVDDDPYARNEVANRRLLVKILSYALERPGKPILLVTSDSDFVPLIRYLVNEGYKIIVASKYGQELVAKESNLCCKWEDLQRGTPKYHIVHPVNKRSW